MIAPVERLRRWLADEPVLYECRDCGTTLEECMDTCSACGSADVARYEFE